MFNVSLEKISKEYKIYARPLDRLIEAVLRKPRHKKFPAVSEISFTLLPGQSLGIIGDNGAGKSTLLKMLSGTITPSSGIRHINGRITALLELGAGFHPEFTGRQNIYLNASLFGLSKKEVEQKEENIISFAELRDFIDRPVKTYSSGMYVRLAFAIATSIDPDILVIDEALSVGDMAFQRKCIERMNRFRSQGKTMIFCSHSMYHVLELCERVVWLESGRIRQMGPSKEVVARYEDYCKEKRSGNPGNGKPAEQMVLQTSSNDCRITNMYLQNENEGMTDTITPLSDVTIKMEVEILKGDLTPQFGFAFLMPDESVCSAALTHHDNISCGPYKAGDKIEVSLNIHQFPLREGTYKLIGGVSESSGLLWYETFYLSPIKVRTNRGFGHVTFHRSWNIEIES